MNKKTFSAILLVSPMVLYATVSCLPTNAAITELWKFSCDLSQVSPLVFDNDLFYLTSKNAASPDEFLYRINASSGKQVWKNKDLAIGDFEVENGRVYVGGKPLTGFGGVFACLNALNGEQVWSHTEAGWFSSPVVAGDLVFVGTMEHIYAFNGLTGEIVWQFENPYGTRFDDWAPVYSEGCLFAVSNYYFQESRSHAGALYALNASNGYGLWKFEAANMSLNSIAASGGEVVIRYEESYPKGVAFSGGILAFDAFNGTALWNYPITISEDLNKGSDVVPIGPPIFDGKIVYEVIENDGVYALDSLTGQIIRHYTVGNESLRYASTSDRRPLITDENLFVVSSVGLHNFDVQDGTLLWSFAPVENKYYGTSPIFANNILFVGFNTSLYALNSFTGKPIWSYKTDYYVSNPIVVKGVVFVGGIDLYTGVSLREGKAAVIALQPDVMSLPSPTNSPTSTATESPSPTNSLLPSNSPLPSPTSSPSPQSTEVPGQFRFSWVEVALAFVVLVVGGLAAYFLRRSQKRETATEP